jgi:hypothetical protein
MLIYKQNLYLQTAIVFFIKRVNQAPLLTTKTISITAKEGLRTIDLDGYEFTLTV